MERKIIFFDAKEFEQEYFDRENKQYDFEITYSDVRLNAQTAVLAEGHDVVCCFVNDVIDRQVIDMLQDKDVNLIALRCAGYNNVDLRAAYKSIHVVRVPEYSPFAVAEHATALILTLNRKTHRAYHRVREGNFTINGLMGFDMHGKTVGVIGTGKIGKIFIQIMKGMGLRVLAHDPYPDEKFARSTGYEYVELDPLLAESDIISLHCPLTESTQHLINKDTISRMKDGVMLINTGRGHLIDTNALIDGLKNRTIGAAGLDVYEEESEYFFEDFSGSFISDDALARLMTFNNVLITSHQGFFTREAIHNIARTTMKNISAFFRDNDLDNEICYRCEEPECVKEKEGKCW